MNDKVFVKGLIVKKPPEKAPDYVKAAGSVKVAEFVAFAKEHAVDGWLNFSIKEAKSGNLYAELDTWKKKDTRPLKQQMDDEIPF